MSKTPHKTPQQVRTDLLKIFTNRDISALSDADSVLIQRTIGSLINPPALSRDMPKADEYARALRVLERTPAKTQDNSNSTPMPDTGFSAPEISLVLQAMENFDFGDQRNVLRSRMNEVLRGMAKGNMRSWHTLSQSTELADMTIYSFLKEALQRAKSPDASRMEQTPDKRSQKKFWDGGVNI